MTAQDRSFDWRVPAIWTVLLGISLFAHAYVEVANEASRGNSITFGRALVIEAASHLVIGALLPVLYWLHRRWPVNGPPRNLLIHVLALVPFSIAHTLGMAALRLLWFVGIAGERYAFPLTIDRLSYEFAKDIVNYALLSAAVLALRHLLARVPASVAAPVPSPSPTVGSLTDRFAVRKRGKEIMVEVADIDWVEAAGNYAVLHVGGETLEIRSSLSKLEGELDPKRFVRVHKSYVVNIARIAEVTPWISGDWRIRLQDGAEVNLSRRYRQRFETLVPVKS
ncbi:MAG TPA: LytTR family DNA-binding domain-containing protein [Reyranella sp.]|jgi:DNA-binding LytR/AlgR family response regulator